MRKQAGVLIGSALLLTAPAMAQANVAERLAAEIRTVLPGSTVSVPDSFELDISYGGQTRSVSIASVHTACQLGELSCKTAIIDYAHRAASYMLEAMPLSRDKLQIVVRSLTSLKAQGASTDELVFEPLSGDLISVCYKNLDGGRGPLISDNLAALKMDGAEALSACKETSHAALPPLAPQLKQLPANGFGIINTGDDVSGYLAAPQDWRAYAGELGSLVVAIPGNDTLLYGRGASPIDIDAIAAFAEQAYAKAAVPVSRQVLRWTDHGWEPVQP